MSFMASTMLSFSPRQLFGAGEQGVWYDPSDIYTLFQDAAGTTPVTAVETAVGLILNKSKGAVGSNGAKRVNLLTYTEQFDNAAWPRGGIYAFGSGSTANVTAPNGTSTADRLKASAVVAYTYQTVTSLASGTYVYSCSIGKGISFTLAFDNGVNGQGVTFDGSTGAFSTYNTIGSGLTVSSYSCSTHPLDSNFWLASITATNPSTTNCSVAVWLNSNKSSNWASGTMTAVNDVLDVWGADLRLTSEASTLPTYQRITADWPSTMAGNHATQSTSASRPVLSARVNVLTKSEALDHADWTKTSMTATGGATDPNGGSTAETLVATGANGTVTQSVTAVATDYIFSVWLKRKTGTGNVDITCHSGGTWVTQSITSSWAKYTVTQTLTAGARTPGIRIVTSGDEVYAFGADLRVSNDGVGLPAYQRVNTSTDYDTAGFPMYLRADGTDDSLATGSIDFSGTDAVTVWAGVRKLSDAARGTVVELTASAASNNGSFHLTAPNAASATYAFESKGTALTDAVVSSNVAAPITSVLCGYSDISSDQNILRVNGAQVDSDTGNQGTGNFSNAALYIGSRGGSSLRFNGRIYGLIVRGSASTIGDINDTERWLAGRMGITL